MKINSLLVIGIGNEMRGDDGVGLYVARAVASLNLPGIEVVTSDGDPADLMEKWCDADRVVVIDACGGAGIPPGSVLRFRAHDQALPVARFPGSSHAFGLARSIELSRAMGSLPRELVVIGIAAGSTQYGTILTPSAALAAERVTAELNRLHRLELQGISTEDPGIHRVHLRPEPR